MINTVSCLHNAWLIWDKLSESEIFEMCLQQDCCNKGWKDALWEIWILSKGLSWSQKKNQQQNNLTQELSRNHFYYYKETIFHHINNYLFFLVLQKLINMLSNFLWVQNNHFPWIKL